MNTGTCAPCKVDCRQGRACPLRYLHRMWIGDVPAPKAVAVATQRDGTLRLLRTSPTPLMAEIDRSDAAEEGGQFREPAPARIPRVRPLFGSKPESTPLTATESASFWGVTLVCVVIFGSALALWAIKTWG